MTHFKKFAMTLLIGAVALISEFMFDRPRLAFMIIAITGGTLAFLMFVEMIKTLRSGKYGVDILAITAIVATLLVNEYWASLMILIMLTGGESLEDYAQKKAGQELQSLLDNTPRTAHKLQGDQQLDVAVDTLEIGDYLVIKPGEIVPADGRVIMGESTFDEASLTGEAKPMSKKVGDELMSGSINGDSSVKMVVEKRAEDSQYQLIIKLVEESKEKPARFVRLADRYAVPFTLIAYLIGGIAWWVSGDPVRFAQVLVVASPCPLILAAPVALVAGMSRSSKSGIVVKTGTAVEKLAETKTIAFDKTGTITKGILEVTGVAPVQGFSEAELLRVAASAEQGSAHILARSLVRAVPQLLPVTDLKEISGQGISATVDGLQVKVGNARFIDVPEAETDRTAIYVAIDEKYAGTIYFSDTIRPEANKTIARLKAQGITDLLMVTGDGRTVAEAIAEEVGLTEVHARCLPQDKLTILTSIPKEKRPVTMVGDGVNDAPALTVADVGIAMGAHGSTAASESADVVILKDDLERVAEAVMISRETMKVAKQSVLIGIFVCVFLMIVASTGVIPALFGAMLQEVVDTVSILSALRAKKPVKQQHTMITQN
ncbi:heavy metal translocating P-type ATPase [Enterococcus mundtii]|uniref:heavy metal translocating P-type ATPase n=1 Tax=Enterococcus TaxID=1350 RepID=UPI00044F0F51|nr:MULTISPECIES: heavy metal translocating P-type ATPase [Enterococcus]AZP92484.1 heavy metal translocating P-type ATPase [Enterococcus mundtii]EYT95992.1 cobalt ABC transporter ATP-binding protein [Enterococcus mundtii CRL35]MDA9428713.1 cadmium-translocating P-type ATPase [Enterococcus mundtii 1A]MDK4211519.1 heavy metal translocating P-type ATPase [Enterococcus mundtii]MDO7878765.1 heavy metal translocating P-type ATPase [Enterococcus mundtii]